MNNKTIMIITMICLAMVLTGCGKDIECPTIEPIEDIVMSVSAGVQEDNYKCDDSGIDYSCYALSKYYTLPNGKCYSVNGNKLCRTGWDLVKIQEPATPQLRADDFDYVCLPMDKGGCRLEKIIVK